MTTTPSLFGHELLRVDSVRALGEVPVENTSVAKYFADERGRKWVGKAYVDTAIEPILAEAISWPLALHLGVKTPAAGYFGRIADDSFIWLSGYVPNNLHWDAAQAGFVENVAALGAMLTLDVVVLNEDRHRRNILLTADTGHESVLTAWSIDMGNALVGVPVDYSSRATETPSTRNLALGLPVSALRSGAVTAARLAQQLSNSPLLEIYVETACRLVDETQGAAILGVLKERMRNAEDMVLRYLLDIEAKQ